MMRTEALSFADAFRDKILPLRERANVRNAWLKQRLDEVLPELMAREGFDIWIVAAREYNEDPVIMTLVPEPAMSARRRTIPMAICTSLPGILTRKGSTNVWREWCKSASLRRLG